MRWSQNRPFLDLAQMCVKPRKSERLRFALSPRGPVPGSVPPELDQSRLVRVQLQPEPREPLVKVAQEPLRILLVLEPDGDVVGEPHDDHVTVRPPMPPPIGPQVENIVEVHVREQR